MLGSPDVVPPPNMLAWLIALFRLNKTRSRQLFRIANTCVAALIGMFVGGAVGSTIAAALGVTSWPGDMVSYFVGGAAVAVGLIIWNWRHGHFSRGRRV